MDKKDQNTQGMAININLDTTPIFYTDNILMTTNQYGLVLNICQNLGPTNQARIVSRVGMSREHAKRFVHELGKMLAITEGQSQTGKKTT